MAGRDDNREDQAIRRWTRLGQLGIKEAFCEAGLPFNSIETLCLLLDSAGDQFYLDNFLKQDGVAEILSETEDSLSVLLAVVGRGDSKIKTLYMASSRKLMLDQAVALCVNLRSNPNVRFLWLHKVMVFGSLEGCTHLANVLRTNPTLKTVFLVSVGMGSEAVKCLMNGLQGHSTLEHLHLHKNPLLNEGIGHVAEMLISNDTLKGLSVKGIRIGVEGAKLLSSALERNNTLEILTFSENAVGRDGMKMLLAPLSKDADAGILSPDPRNTTLKELHLGNMTLEDFSVESLAWMIRTNETLSALSLWWLEDMSVQDWTKQIIPALRENRTLKTLDFYACGGLNGKEVSVALMELAQFSHTRLERIRLDDTGMQNLEGRINEELRVNKEFRMALRGQMQTKPKSGRLVLCGYEFAGKTTILTTMKRILYGTSFGHLFGKRWTKMMTMFPFLQQLCFGVDSQTKMSQRTRGVDIVFLTKDSNACQLSVWDFAGQKEYYALHDFVFPDAKNSCFLFVCSCRCSPDARDKKGKIKDKGSMRDEFYYWLRFIASNSKPLQVEGGQMSQLPHVTFVLTKKDTLDAGMLRVSTQVAQEVVTELKVEFEDVIMVSQTLEVVNAHSFKDVKRLTSLLKGNLANILESSTEYAICEEVRHALEKWSIEHPLEPLLSLDQFETMCNEEVNSRADPQSFADVQLQSGVGRQLVLSYLNHAGDIIYTKGLDFIVANPRWFGVGVLGSLIDAFGRIEDPRQPRVWKWNGLCGARNRFYKLGHKQGFVTRSTVDGLLKHSLETMHLKQTICTHQLIQLMIHLELCFENKPGEDIFIPALFDDEEETAARGKRQLEWKLVQPHAISILYIGIRLECEKKSITFLTPGFFPRLQVHLLNYIHQKNWTKNGAFEVGRDLISFAENGVEVFVEYCGYVDYFVDIMVKSTKSYEETKLFVTDHVIKKIVDFCASPQGCQGVLLVQAVIRPVCVSKLHLCVDRKPHAVSVSILEDHIKSDPKYTYTWPEPIEGVSDIDFALDLLRGKGSHKRLVKESRGLLKGQMQTKPKSSHHELCDYESADWIDWSSSSDDKDKSKMDEPEVSDNVLPIKPGLQQSNLAGPIAQDMEIKLPEIVPFPQEHSLGPKFPWTKGEVLGAGSFGTVYEAVDRDGMWFAVKEVSMAEQDNHAQKCIAQLMQEIDLLSQFKHDNIVQYLGTEKAHGKLYIFLELASKGSLAVICKKNKLLDSQISAYTREILKGLKYLHDRCIVHRDIKCANILVDTKGVCKLADFGMAKQISRVDQTKSCKGSAYWMAPEVIDPKKVYGPPADIWSLGCSIIEMATGSPPFGDMEWYRVLWTVGKGTPPPIPDSLSDAAKDFVKNCLEVNPMKRPTATRLLEHQFVWQAGRLTTTYSTSMSFPPAVPNLQASTEEIFADLSGTQALGNGNSSTTTSS